MGALKDYDAALKFDRRNVNAYIARGALLLACGATAKARADMRRALRSTAKTHTRCYGTKSQNDARSRRACSRAARDCATWR